MAVLAETPPLPSYGHNAPEMTVGTAVPLPPDAGLVGLHGQLAPQVDFTDCDETAPPDQSVLGISALGSFNDSSFAQSSPARSSVAARQSVGSPSRQADTSSARWKAETLRSLPPVYVQSASRMELFHPTSASKAQRAFNKTAIGSSADAPASHWRPHAGRIAALNAAVVDLDAAELCLWDPDDAAVFELLSQKERTRGFASIAFFAAQGLLAGLCLVSMLLAHGASADASIVSVPNAGAVLPDSGTLYPVAPPLSQMLYALEPGLGRFTMVCAELAFIGSVLQARNAWDRFSGFDGRSSGDESEQAGLRQAIVQATCCIMAAMANGTCFFCCLLSGRGDALLFQKSATSMNAQTREERVDDYDWALQLLIARSAMGLVATPPALYDIQQLLFPILPNALLTKGLFSLERRSDQEKSLP